MEQVKLPQQVCILDLETEKLKRGTPENTPLAFVGVVIYTLSGGKYCAGEHLCFLKEDLEELETFLSAFDGVIIGHNIFGFDYKVLGSNISVEEAISKTVDTLPFLYERNGETLSGLSLDNLAQRNFGQSTGQVKGRSIPQMWREGRKEEVIAYNKQDLNLTYLLWEAMVSGRTVRTEEPKDRTAEPIRFGFEFQTEIIEITEDDRLRLTGQKPLFGTCLVFVTGGPDLGESPPGYLSGTEDGYWYIGSSAKQDLETGMLYFEDFPGTGHFLEPPYPADWFKIAGRMYGPSLPDSGSPEIDMDDL